ncbi:Ger(x)C family spore germination protein [Alicyclobacillus fastidiosus]|uniref:Ger(X)C family spore germination protein n=1 Tax=Alicyclobacillus fastidiosus TaxID=392011 RepID=A0ABV5AKB0_9BACL|nr:Ger(x)C family spore germination protein [Alicyclobacillus fastidiosus]WEH11027.1 Ger(x)C family spore germination protein [Alicyclobacillus fastidiosus]
MPTRNWAVRLRLLWTVIFITPLLTGCWDRLEVEQRATVLGLSIDTMGSQTTDGSDQGAADEPSDVMSSIPSSAPGKAALRLTAQIAVPGRIPLGPGETGGGGSGNPQEAVWVLHSNGKTLSEAIQRLQQQVADKLFLGHLRVIVISEEFARHEGLETVTDTLRRNPEVRRTAWLMVSKGDAAEVMRTAPPLERVPTLYLMSTMDHARQMGKLPNDFLGKFESKAVSKGRQGVLPYVEITQKDNINVAGLAFFKGYKMVSTTKKTFDIATYMELAGISRGGYSMMVPVPNQSGAVMVQGYRRKRRIKVDIRNGIPHFTVVLHLDNSITEKTSENFSVDNPKIIREIEGEVEQSLQANTKEFIEQTKAEDVDVIGFGEYVRARKRQYWDRNVRTREMWDQLYPKASMDVQITVKIHRVGMKGT